MKRNSSITAELLRADRIIGWMAEYIGRVCPPDDGISELNEHWLFMERHGIIKGKQITGPALSERRVP